MSGVDLPGKTYRSQKTLVKATGPILRETTFKLAKTELCWT